MDYETSEGVKEALAAIDGGAEAVMVVGRAGTGKTTLIRYLRQMPGGETQAVIAPTAVAALNAQAQTIHSFFRLPHGVLDARELPDAKNFGTLYRKMRRLVIDEISMVRADVVDAIDARLRDIRDDERPFGGVQVVMVGDFLQLPPVVQNGERELLGGLGYRAPFAFAAKVFERMRVATASLEKVHRQEEADFIDLLSRVRVGEATAELAEVFNARCFAPHREGREPLLLTATRASADGHNRRGLSGLPDAPVFFDGVVEGRLEIDRDRLPVPDRLELRVGARVMAAKNDPMRRFINGSLGTVLRFQGKGVVVRFDHSGCEESVEVASWEKVRQQWNAGSGRIENEVVGAYRQIPLLHAWAITIHKAQGLSLDDVRIDLGGGAFASGQLYVALSRARTMAGLSLARRIKPTDLRADPMLLAFVDWAKASAGR
jgi:ATP-dependent exoDNAse (exonuclease V) alpha subunit